ncbi:4Fe-4S single cluster domain-containing protein [Oscillatoria laete-virens NRMC-F 0139]|nr:4Fe-4S single cluster domain-containing protein [Oscillatoria laete-virens]MDL5052651.1 4Fe-4S single cluster domain-containing protein [Oscillatoria laete-virens NRMC-F 0139]
MTLINLADFCPATRVLGPGLRFVIWVQGCCFRCPGCVSPDTIPQVTATLVEPKVMARLVLQNPELEGITVSGGEPMLQAPALNQLFATLRQESNLSIICYTGFKLEQLQAKNDSEINTMLSYIDVLIDGLYIQEQNDNKGWRGSANQVVHFLTTRHLKENYLFTQRKRDIEIYLRNDNALMVGVPPRQFNDQFPDIIADVNDHPRQSFGSNVQ